MARFINICDAFDLPVVILCDTPGFMVGQKVEHTALVRHSVRVIMALANATVPILTVVLRKAYGLGYYAMGSGPFDPALLVGWPTAEFGGMGLEGAVNIVHKRELDEAPEEAARREIRARYAEELRQQNTGMGWAERYGLHDLIDPADTRAVLTATLRAIPVPPRRTERKHPIDPW